MHIEYRLLSNVNFKWVNVWEQTLEFRIVRWCIVPFWLCKRLSFLFNISRSSDVDSWLVSVNRCALSWRSFSSSVCRFAVTINTTTPAQSQCERHSSDGYFQYKRFQPTTNPFCQPVKNLTILSQYTKFDENPPPTVALTVQLILHRSIHTLFSCSSQAKLLHFLHWNRHVLKHKVYLWRVYMSDPCWSPN